MKERFHRKDDPLSETLSSAAIPQKPTMYGLYASPMSGDQIETRSMEIIESEADTSRFQPEEWEVVRRMIHTTADLSLIESVAFGPGAITAGVAALKAGKPLYVDSNMIRSGISLARLRSVCPSYSQDNIMCHVADPDVAALARENGMPRSLYAVRKAGKQLDGCIAAIGNAPVALMELSRMIIERECRPSLVIAMPVGFVHVVESKQELMSLDMPFIALSGRRGGSALAVSVVHALCSIAARQG